MHIEEGHLVHIFMSEQNQYEGYALQLYRAMLNREPPFEFRDRLDDSMTFGSHKRYPPLQAADLAAYHLYQYCLARRVDRMAVPSRMFKRIYALRENTHDIIFADEEAIAKDCARFHKRKAHADNTAMLRHTRLRVKVSHDPQECEVIGTVDASGNYHPTVPDI